MPVLAAATVAKALQAAQALAPVAKAAMVYKPSKFEKQYRENIEAEQKRLANGAGGMSAGQRAQLTGEAMGQIQSAEKAAQAELVRGQGGAGALGAGQAQQMALQVTQAGMAARNQAQSQVRAQDLAQAQAQRAKLEQAQLNAIALERARREAALAELSKTSPEAVAGAFGQGQGVRGTTGEAFSTTAAGAY